MQAVVAEVCDVPKNGFFEIERNQRKDRLGVRRPYGRVMNPNYPQTRPQIFDTCWDLPN